MWRFAMENVRGRAAFEQISAIVLLECGERILNKVETTYGTLGYGAQPTEVKNSDWLA